MDLLKMKSWVIWINAKPSIGFRRLFADVTGQGGESIAKLSRSTRIHGYQDPAVP